MEALVRIDKGVKRGPRRKDAPPRPNKRTWLQAGSKSVAVEQRDQIIAHVAAGRFLRDIAADLGVTPAAISQYLASDPEYKAAREAGIEQQLERWQASMETAADALNLARAREAFRATAWRAEREMAHRWGQKQEITHNVAPVLHIHTASDQHSVVDVPHALIESKG
jgi:hypothetical protein